MPDNDNRQHGVLVIDKPTGLTSAAVVARVKRALAARRVGHTGTLDPMATGVLPLCIGEATKIAGYLLAEDKSYEAELELGVETDTLDADGEITARQPEAAAAVSAADLAAVLRTLLGPGEQIPPMYSAVKHRGKRLYTLARAGQTVERAPRPITIHRLDVLDIALPRLRLAVHASKGTYIRTLAADIGRALGCGAHLTALRRTQSGAFTLDQAIQLSEIKEKNPQLIDPAQALGHLPGGPIPAARVGDIASGKPLPWHAVSGAPCPDSTDQVVKLLTPDGHLLALVQVDGHGRLRYRRVFTYALT